MRDVNAIITTNSINLLNGSPLFNVENIPIEIHQNASKLAMTSRENNENGIYIGKNEAIVSFSYKAG